MSVEIPELKSKLFRIAEIHGKAGYEGIAELLRCRRDTPRNWVRDTDNGPNQVPDARMPQLVDLVRQGAKREIPPAEARSILLGPFIMLYAALDASPNTVWTDFLRRSGKRDVLSLIRSPVRELGATQLYIQEPAAEDAIDIEWDTHFGFTFTPPATTGEVALLRCFDREWRTLPAAIDGSVTLACQGDIWRIPGNLRDGRPNFYFETEDEGPALFVAIGVRGNFPETARRLLEDHQPLAPLDRDRLAELLSNLPQGAVRVAALNIFFVADRTIY